MRWFEGFVRALAEFERFGNVSLLAVKMCLPTESRTSANIYEHQMGDKSLHLKIWVYSPKGISHSYDCHYCIYVLINVLLSNLGHLLEKMVAILYLLIIHTLILLSKMCSIYHEGNP